MSIDIHAFVEASVLVNGSPICVESIATVHMQCDLQLFSLMAGAGSQAQALYPARGLPEDAGEDSRGAIELIVVDELTAMAPDNACTRKEADLWVKKGASRYLDASRNKITDHMKSGAIFTPIFLNGFLFSEMAPSWSFSF